MSASVSKPLVFKGSKNFRQRVILATLSGRAIRIDDIRAYDEDPGVRGETTSRCWRNVRDGVRGLNGLRINRTRGEKLNVCVLCRP